MLAHSIPRRSFTRGTTAPITINWRRGLFRSWILVTAAWIMSWTIYLIIGALRYGLRAGDAFAVPVLLFGPPLALLIFVLGIGWAFRGFERIEPARARGR
jgi:hypothetical protein